MIVTIYYVPTNGHKFTTAPTATSMLLLMPVPTLISALTPTFKPTITHAQRSHDIYMQALTTELTHTNHSPTSRINSH